MVRLRLLGHAGQALNGRSSVSVLIAMNGSPIMETSEVTGIAPG